MAKVAYIGGFFILLLIALYLIYTQSAEKQNAKPIDVVNSKQTTPQSVVKNTGLKIPSTVKSPMMNPSAHPFRSQTLSDLGLVPFKVEDGLAIAYGDIILGEPEAGAKEGFYRPSRPRLWKSSEIPFAISPELSDPGRVQKAIGYFHKNTPISFIPFENQDDAIIFEPGNKHCYSFLGQTGGHQPIRLSDKCRWQEIVHEIMHALGFIHEHSRVDRDQYVEVLWENVDEKYESQFAMIPPDLMETVRGTKFDYESIMLYSPNSFARKKGLKTLQSLSSQTISPRKDGLSKMDIERLNYFYGN